MTREEQLGIRLCDWFDENMRDLPWRHTRDPYGIWVSEIMLQQTRVDTVISYYLRFMQRFPQVSDLAQATRDEVFKLWEGLGYYRRAEYLLKGAKYVYDHLDGCFPRSMEELKKIPGIGEYTAGAIASMSFDQRVAAVDGNVLRVISRLEAITASVDQGKVRKIIADFSVRMIPKGRSWSHTQSLMELGALICLPQRPACDHCPVEDHCQARGKGIQEVVPVLKPRKKQLTIHRRVYMIACNGRVLLRRRPLEGLLGGMWEFPGDDEPYEESFLEHVTVASVTSVLHAQHVFTHRIWEMEGLWVEASSLTASEGCEWFHLSQLEEIALPTAMASFKEYVKKRL